MCGIAGILYANNQSPDFELLKRMSERLIHRGPDEQGIAVWGPIGLVQTRLSIIGLSNGHQPLISADQQILLVVNGEVYNYLELNQIMFERGCVFQTDSDSETILHAYALDGLQCLKKLRGMYAFALYDTQKKQLILGRDRLGIKPLFYLKLFNCIVFASEIKALIPAIPYQLEISPSGLSQFLHHQFAGGENTIFNEIKRVLPGEVLIIDENLNIKNYQYWSAQQIKPCYFKYDQALDELNILLNLVMQEHLRSDVPAGLFLSGGVDSSVLAILLHNQNVEHMQSFSLGYQDARMPQELNAAARLADWFGFEHHEIQLDRDQLLARFPHTIWCTDELMLDYACLPTSFLAEVAGLQFKNKIVFSGEGGDEIFAGYRRYAQNPLERWVKNFFYPGSGGFRVRGQWPQFWSKKLFGPELQKVLKSNRYVFTHAWQETPDNWSDLQRRQYTDLITALPDNLLVKTDRILMGFGIEGRVPFLDHRLVEFALSLPDSLKIKSKQSKWLLRQWAEPFLPAGHLKKPKRGFYVPIGEYLTNEIVEQIGQRLIKNSGIRAWFKVAALPDLIAAQRRGQVSNRVLWSLLQFAIWHRLFIEENNLIPSLNENLIEWIA